MKNKKAQTEIIGLVVIVILLTILAVIFLSFALRPKATTPDVLRTSTKADNLLNSIIRTNTQDNQKMLDFIVNSYESNEYTSLNKEINSIITKTLPNKQYGFKILINEDNFLEINNCNTGIVSLKTINHKGNYIKFELKIC